MKSFRTQTGEMGYGRRAGRGGTIVEGRGEIERDGRTTFINPHCSAANTFSDFHAPLCFPLTLFRARSLSLPIPLPLHISCAPTLYSAGRSTPSCHTMYIPLFTPSVPDHYAHMTLYQNTSNTSSIILYLRGLPLYLQGLSTRPYGYASARPKSSIRP